MLRTLQLELDVWPQRLESITLQIGPLFGLTHVLLYENSFPLPSILHIKQLVKHFLVLWRIFDQLGQFYSHFIFLSMRRNVNHYLFYFFLTECCSQCDWDFSLFLCLFNKFHRPIYKRNLKYPVFCTGWHFNFIRLRSHNFGMAVVRAGLTVFDWEIHVHPIGRLSIINTEQKRPLLILWLYSEVSGISVDCDLARLTLQNRNCLWLPTHNV